MNIMQHLGRFVLLSFGYIERFVVATFFVGLFNIGCSIPNTELVRTIYYKEPVRSDDLVVVPRPKLLELSTTGAEIDDVSIFVEQDFFSSVRDSSKELPDEAFHSLRLSKSKVNDLVVGKHGEAYVGHQDGALFSLVPDSKQDVVEKSKSVVYTKIAQGNKPIITLSLSPNERFLAVSQFSVVTIIDLQTHEIAAQMHRVKGRITSLAWSPDGTQLLLGRTNGDVFGWNLGSDLHYAADTTEVLNVYETEPSPVQEILFHPSGRAFFAVLENGAFFSIRLIRTEVELGLRDDDRSVKLLRGRYVRGFARIPGGVADMSLSSDSSQLLAPGRDGVMYRWNIRGLLPILSLTLKNREITRADLVSLWLGESLEELAVVLGRDLELEVYCLKEAAYSSVVPTSDVYQAEKIGSDIDSGSEHLQEVADLIAELKRRSTLKKSDEVKVVGETSSISEGLLFSSPRFRESVSTVVYSEGSGLLWLGSKSGIVSFANLRHLISTGARLNQLNKCTSLL